MGFVATCGARVLPDDKKDYLQQSRPISTVASRDGVGLVAVGWESVGCLQSKGLWW